MFNSKLEHYFSLFSITNPILCLQFSTDNPMAYFKFRSKKICLPLFIHARHTLLSYPKPITDLVHNLGIISSYFRSFVWREALRWHSSVSKYSPLTNLTWVWVPLGSVLYASKVALLVGSLPCFKDFSKISFLIPIGIPVKE